MRVTDDAAGTGGRRKEGGAAEGAPRKQDPGPHGRPGEGMLAGPRLISTDA